MTTHRLAEQSTTFICGLPPDPFTDGQWVNLASHARGVELGMSVDKWRSMGGPRLVRVTVEAVYE